MTIIKTKGKYTTTFEDKYSAFNQKEDLSEEMGYLKNSIAAADQNMNEQPKQKILKYRYHHRLQVWYGSCKEGTILCHFNTEKRKNRCSIRPKILLTLSEHKKNEDELVTLVNNRRTLPHQ